MSASSSAALPPQQGGGDASGVYVGAPTTNVNRLSECPTTAMLAAAQRLRASAYMPLTQAGVDEAFAKAHHLRPPHWAAEEALVGLYTALNGSCGVHMLNPRQEVSEMVAQQHYSHQHQHNPSAATPAVAGSAFATSGGSGSGEALSGEEALEAFRRQQLAQNAKHTSFLKGSASGGAVHQARGICYNHTRGGCSKGSTCPFLHPARK